MEYRSLSLDDREAWARLLAVSFDRTPAQMDQLLAWFHRGFELVTWGAWDGDRLVAQYCCRMLRLHIPCHGEPATAGMGLDMAVDPEYRGRGLLRTVAEPVHEMVSERGAIAGVGFSSPGGLSVTQASSTYGYRVLGPMTSTIVVLTRRRYPAPLELAEDWPEGDPLLSAPDASLVRYEVTASSLRHRFAEHPFRRYSFGVRREDGQVTGLVIYRPVRLRGIPGVALLAAYGQDMPALLAGWAGALRRNRVSLIHVVTSPAAPLREIVRSLGTRLTVPMSRNRYHLIARALRDDTPSLLFELDRWDCVGGDIL